MVDEGRVSAWIRQTETELMGALKFHKYDEAGKLLGELRIAMIEGMSPTLFFDGIYRLLGCFTRCNEGDPCGKNVFRIDGIPGSGNCF